MIIISVGVHQIWRLKLKLPNYQIKIPINVPIYSSYQPVDYYNISLSYCRCWIQTLTSFDLFVWEINKLYSFICMVSLLLILNLINTGPQWDSMPQSCVIARIPCSFWGIQQTGHNHLSNQLHIG